MVVFTQYKCFSGPHHHSSRHLGPGMPDELKSEPLSLSGNTTVGSDLSDSQMGLQQPEEEEVPSPNHIPRGPSPEPKIEDTECHRSQSAMWVVACYVRAVMFKVVNDKFPG
jgi:arginine-glutamic acid dipeptide repeat-containing protein